MSEIPIISSEAVLATIDSQTAMNIAEAAAKLWIGNGASVIGEGYGVITEGLSRYLASQFIENKFGKDVADVERLRQRTSYAAVSKRDAALSKASPLDDYYYPAVANKGAMVWRLLAKRVGQPEFSKIVTASLQDGNVNLAELRSAFSAQKDIFQYIFLLNASMGLTTVRKLFGKVKLNYRNNLISILNTWAFWWMNKIHWLKILLYDCRK